MNSKANLASTATRLLLGLIFFVFGLNGLLMLTNGTGFIPMPPPAPEFGEIMGGLSKVVYLMPLVKILEVVAGALLLSGKFVRLALVILAPIVVNIFAVHLVADPAGLPIAIVVTALLGHQLYVHWSAFRPLLEVSPKLKGQAPIVEYGGESQHSVSAPVS